MAVTANGVPRASTATLTRVVASMWWRTPSAAADAPVPRGGVAESAASGEGSAARRGCAADAAAGAASASSEQVQPAARLIESG